MATHMRDNRALTRNRNAVPIFPGNKENVGAPNEVVWTAETQEQRRKAAARKRSGAIAFMGREDATNIKCPVEGCC